VSRQWFFLSQIAKLSGHSQVHDQNVAGAGTSSGRAPVREHPGLVEIDEDEFTAASDANYASVFQSSIERSLRFRRDELL